MSDKKHKLKGLRLDELSLVDQPANKQAKVAIAKRQDSEESETMTETEKATHPDKEMTEKEKARAKEIMDKEGLSERDAMDKAMREMRKDDSDTQNAGSPGETQPAQKEDTTMSQEQDKRLGDLEKQLAQIKSEVEKQGFAVTEKNDGSVELAKSQDETLTDPQGNTVRKSEVGESTFNIMKAQAEELRKLQEDRNQESLRKRADAELPNLKGSADVRGAVIKAIEDGIQDEETRKEAQEMLKAADGFAKNAFAEIGKSLADDEETATGQLEKLAKQYASDNGVDYYTAFAEVTKQGEGKSLLAKSRSEQRGN